MKSFKLFMEEQETPPRSEISAKEALGRYFPHVKIPKKEEEAKSLFDALVKKEEQYNLDTKK